jgi:hypothetical protein
MKIVTSSSSLDLSGVPTFTLTMYHELVKRGHQVTVYSPEGGKLETEMNVVKNIDEVLLPDVIIAQHNLCADSLKKAFPNIPLLFYSHGILPEPEQPPKFPTDWYLAINEEVQKNLLDKGIPAKKISIVRDFINTDRFVSTKPLHEKIEQVLFISNYKKWKNFKTVDAACKKLGVKLVCFGSPYGRNYKIEEAINEADLVISWGRGILEAMSCGRAALSFDRFEGDGYITSEAYLEARKNNFSGRIFKYAFTGDMLAEEMLKYDPNCSEVNRGLIMKYHNAVSGVDQILEIIKKIWLYE